MAEIAHSAASEALGRHTYEERTAYATSHTRQTHSRPGRTLHPEEQAQRRVQAKTKKISYNEKLAHIYDYLLAQAREFHEEDPSHTSEYYMSDILAKSRIAHSTRDGNLWCAYLSLRMNEINTGT